ncbi:flagellar motor protein MotB [Planctomycetota bacterium]
MKRIVLLTALLSLFVIAAGCQGKDKTTPEPSKKPSNKHLVTIIKGQENRINQLERDLQEWTDRATQAELDLLASQERLSVLTDQKPALIDNTEMLDYLEMIDRRISQMDTTADEMEITPLADNSGYKITILGDVLFDSGSDVIRKEGKAILAKLAPELVKVDGTIRIDGHTDNKPVARSQTKARFPKGNWQLGAERALEVLFFLKKAGVPQNKMFYTSWGEFNPREDNRKAAGRKKNRRVEILVVFNA